jgi:hypothetical protein
MDHEVTAIDRERCAALPPLPPGRRRIIQRRCLTHNQWRLLRHQIVDPDRARYVNLVLGMAGSPFWSAFGDPRILLHQPLYAAQVIKFPERRSSEIAKLKAELADLKRAIARTTLTAGAKAGAMCAVGT